MAKGLKIWKTIMLVSLLCLLLALGGGMLACHPGESHTHDWSETYSYDDDNHWLSCSGCDQRTGTEPHVFDNDQDTTCNVCGYTRHVHTLVWKNDGNVNGKHWQEYSCEHHSDERLNEGDHVWGNDNICDVCLLDKTPPHVHHEITRYDETQHWTTYDCTEHGNEKINPQPHTFTNGSKCDGCDYDRDAEHQHSLSGWIHNNDPQYHWKEYTCWHHADEQLEKTPHNFNGDDECDDCGYVRQHLHDNYLVWNFDQTQHWQTYTCNDEKHNTEKEETRGDHDFGTGGVCSCGLNRNYIRVYDIYTAQKTYERDNGISDDEIAGFNAWYNSLKAQGVDHVGVNAMGDVFFYNSKDDTTGTLTYVSERTVAVSTSVVNAWFTVKATVDGEEPKVLAIAKTGRNGVELKFFPLWKDAAYTVGIATVKDIEDNTEEVPIPLPKYYVNIGESSSYDIQPFEESSISQSFSIVRGLGLDESGAYGGVYLKSYMEEALPFYFAKDDTWQDGWYKLTLVETSDCLMQDGLEFSFSIDPDYNIMQNPYTMSIVGKKAVAFIWVDSSIDKIYMRWGGLGSVSGSLKLEKVYDNDLTIENNTEFDMRINQPDEQKKLEYDISNLTPGRYKVIKIYKLDRSKHPEYSYCTFSIDGDATQPPANAVLEIPEGAQKLVCTQTSGKIIYQAYQSLTLRFIKIEDYTTGDQYSVDAKNGYKIEDSHLGYYYLNWKTPATGSYKLTLSGSPEFTNVTVVAHGENDIYDNSGITWLNHNTAADKSETHEAYFNSTQDKEYWIAISTDDTNNSQYPQTLTFKLEKIESLEFEVNTEATATFGAESKTLSYLGELTKGAYMVVMTGENLVNVTLEVTAINDKCTVTSSGINSLIVHDDCTATVLAKYSGSDNYPTVKFVIIKMDEGTSITEIGKGGYTSTANLSGDKYFQVFTFTETESNFYKLTLNSSNNLQNVYVYCAIYDENNSSENKKTVVQNWLSPVTAEATTREFIGPISYYDTGLAASSTVGAKYSIVVLQQKNSEYPGDISFKLEKTINPSYYAIGREYAGVMFTNAEHATGVEVWCAALDERRTPNDGEYQLKTTIDPKDYAADDHIFYAENNREDIANKYLYWKLVFKDSTGTYVDGFITGSNGTQYRDTGLTTTVTVNVPEDFEGKHITVGFGSNYLALYGVYVIDVVPKQTEYTVQILTPTTSSAGKKNYTFFTELSADIAEKYAVNTVSAKYGTDTGKITISHKVAITATINLPDNFEQPEGSDLTVYIYRLTNGVLSHGVSAVATIDAERNTATATIFAGYYETLIAKLTGLDKGYEASAEQYDVTVAEGNRTGTVTLTVNQRTKVDVEITVPALFTGGEITLKFYKYTGEEVAKNATDYKFELDPNYTGEAVKRTVSVYLPRNTSYKIEFVGPANMGYAADSIEKLDLNDTTVKAEINVIDHVQITANVELPGSIVEESITVYLNDGDTDAIVSSAIVQVAADETSGKKTGSAILYGTSGHHYYVAFGSSTSYTTDIDKASADVKMNGVTGEATVVGIEKYSVEVTIGFENLEDAQQYTQSLSNLYLYQDGKQIAGRQIPSKTGSGAEKHWTVMFYISQTIFDENAVYACGIPTANIPQSYYILPSARITGWSAEQLHVDLRMNLLSETTLASLAKPIDYTIIIPEEYTPETTTHVVEVYELYGAEWSNNKSSFNVDFASAKDGKITGTYSDYVQSELLYFNLRGGDLTNLKSTSITTSRNYITEWYAKPGTVTYDDEGRGHVEINIYKTIPVKLTIPALDNRTSTLEFTVNIDILDAHGNKVALYRYTVPENASAEDIENATIYMLNWDTSYTAKVSISGTNPAYIVDEEHSFEFKEDNGYELQLNLTKLMPVKVTIPNLDNSTDTVKFDITLKLKADNVEVATYTIAVPANASASGFEYYIYVPEWLEDYKIEVSSSTAGSAYVINSATHNEADGVHSIEIDVTKKEALKVTIPNLDAGLKASQFNLNVTIKDSKAETVYTFTLTIPANAPGSFSQYVYFDKWEAGYSAEVTGTSAAYTIEGAEIKPDTGEVHNLEINVKVRPQVRIVIKGLSAEAEAPQITLSIIITDESNQKIANVGTISIPAGAAEYEETGFIINIQWQEGYKFEVRDITTSQSPYTFGGEWSKESNDIFKFTVTATQEKVKAQVKVVIPVLDSKYNAPEFTFKVKIENFARTTVASEDIAVSAKAGSDFSTIIYGEEGYSFDDCESLRIDLDIDTNVQKTIPYIFDTMYNTKTAKITREADGTYVLTITPTLKPIVKVVIPCLDGTIEEDFTFNFTIQNKNNAKSSVTFTVTVPAKATSDFEYFAFVETWPLSSVFKVPIASTTCPLKITAGTISEADGIHVLTLEATIRHKVTITGTCPVEFTESAAQSITTRIYDGGTMKTAISGRFTVGATTLNSYAYINELEEGYTASTTTNVEGFNIVLDFKVIRGGNDKLSATLTITVTAAEA